MIQDKYEFTITQLLEENKQLKADIIELKKRPEVV